MTADDIDDATLRLALARGVGPATWRRLRSAFGGDDAIVGASIGAIANALGGSSGRSAAAIHAAIRAVHVEPERAAMRRCHVGILRHGAPTYPVALTETPGAPEVLWVRGAWPVDREAARAPAVAIVGSRRASAYGRRQAERFAAALAERGLAVVSGGAYGIDAAAHRGAVQAGGITVAVLGSGLAHAYPSEHAPLFETIVAAGGAVLSEFPTTCPPRPGQFPRRNRTISGLARGTLVIEAGRRSGALITARFAVEEHGREAMVVPGRLEDPNAEGGLRLLRSGGAALVLDAEDVLFELGLGPDAAPSGRGASAPASPSPLALPADPAVERTLREVAASSPVTVERLAEALDLPIGTLFVHLTALQLGGWIDRDAAGIALRATRTGLVGSDAG